MRVIFATIAVFGILTTAVYAEEVLLTLEHHQFSPEKITIPAEKKVTLRIKNLDSTPAEFESDELRREKIIPGNSEALITIGPLQPGSYTFFDEFNSKTAQGQLVVE